MAVVDPRLQRIPNQLTKERDVRLYFEDLERFLHDLWVRTGGGNDAISNLGIEEVYPWPRKSIEQDSTESPYASLSRSKSDNAVSPYSSSGSSRADGKAVEFYSVKPDMPQKVFRSVSASSNYTASDFDFINAKVNAIITFPSAPEENAVLIIRNGDGSKIGLIGNGRNINGESSGNIRNKGTAIAFQYFIDDNEWYAR